MLTMLPPRRAIISSQTARVQFTTPQMLRSSSHCISSRGFSTLGRG